MYALQIETFLDEMCERFPGTLRTAATATADVGRRRGGGKAVVDVGDPPSIDYHRFVDWSCDERRQVLMRRVQRHVFKMPAAAQQKLVKNVRRAFERADPSGDGTLGKIQFGRLMSSVGAMLGFSGTCPSVLSKDVPSSSSLFFFSLSASAFTVKMNSLTFYVFWNHSMIPLTRV